MLCAYRNQTAVAKVWKNHTHQWIAIASLAYHFTIFVIVAIVVFVIFGIFGIFGNLFHPVFDCLIHALPAYMAPAFSSL